MTFPLLGVDEPVLLDVLAEMGQFTRRLARLYDEVIDRVCLITEYSRAVAAMKLEGFCRSKAALVVWRESGDRGK